MEIRIEQRLTGAELKSQILDRYGSVDRLVEMASQTGNLEAQDDLSVLREFDEDPTRLGLSTVVTTIASLSTKDLERLTPERLRLLDVLAARKDAPSLTTLSRRLRRDRKNVSDDLRLLTRLKLVSVDRHGKELSARAQGSEIRILLRGPTS